MSHPEDTRRATLCGDVLLNADGSYEQGYGWEYGGVAPPYYGAIAECYQGEQEVCAVFMDLGQFGFDMDGYADVYLWRDDSGSPGEVIAMVPHTLMALIAMYPQFSRHEVVLPEPICTPDRWWAGYWPDWPNQSALWCLGADLNGPGGCPKTNIAPGQGFPSGWQEASLVWGPMAAMGIGAEVQPCPPTPTRDTSWGRVKSLFR